MAYEFFVAARYLGSRGKAQFISLIGYIAMGGVVIGVAALVIVLAVFNGFESEVQNRIIGERAHIHIYTLDSSPMIHYQEVLAEVQQDPRVVGATPYVLSQAVLATGKTTQGVVVVGVDPAREKGVTELHQNIVSGSLDLAKSATKDGVERYGIVLGRGLAMMLGIIPGDEVIVASLQGDILTPGWFPRVEKFRVVGVFESGLYEYDSSFSYIALEAAQKLFRLGDGVTGIAVKVEQMFLANQIGDELEQMLRQRIDYNYYVTDWMYEHRTLFSWMKLEKWISFLVLNLIVLVAAFNIVSILIMVVLEKRKDIGVLKSMGASRRGILQIFLWEGVIIGLIGTGFGCLLGFGLCWLQATYRLITLPAGIYFISAMPILMKPVDFVVIALGAMAICLLATFYPAWRASRLDPVAAIRYE